MNIPDEVRTARILIVEDSPGTLESLSTISKNAGFEVVTAKNVEVAKDFLTRYRTEPHRIADSFSVAIIDLALESEGADQKGFEVLSFAIQDPCTEAIILTAYGNIASVQKAHLLGAFTHLDKGEILESENTERLKLILTVAHARCVFSRTRLWILSELTTLSEAWLASDKDNTFKNRLSDVTSELKNYQRYLDQFRIHTLGE